MKQLDDVEEALFFHWLGYRLFSTVLRGHVLGHKRPFSAARDYLRLESLEGADRTASEFLVDVAHIVSQDSRGRRSLEEVFQKWCETARWHPAEGIINLEPIFEELRRLVEESESTTHEPLARRNEKGTR